MMHTGLRPFPSTSSSTRSARGRYSVRPDCMTREDRMSASQVVGWNTTNLILPTVCLDESDAPYHSYRFEACLQHLLASNTYSTINHGY